MNNDGFGDDGGKGGKGGGKGRLGVRRMRWKIERRRREMKDMLLYRTHQHGSTAARALVSNLDTNNIAGYPSHVWEGRE